MCIKSYNTNDDFSLFAIHTEIPKMVRKENVVDYEIIIIIIKNWHR